MWIFILRLALPVAFQFVSRYIKSSDSKKDDTILMIAKESAKYLSLKDNNTLTSDISLLVTSSEMKK